MLTDDIGEMGLTWVGRPMEVVRVLDPVYLDQAKHGFREYVRRTLTVGRFADLMDADTAARWDVSPAVLTAQDPTPHDRDICWAVGRAVRAVGDFLRSPSARTAGANIPIFADRERGDLRMEIQYGVRQAPPEHLRQHTDDPW